MPRPPEKDKKDKPDKPPKTRIDRKRPDGKKRGDKFEDYGGETISVDILVNGKRIFHRSASIADEFDGNENKARRYTTDNGEEINHNRRAGVKVLAKKLIDL